MTALVVDASDKKLYLEMEICYEDGTVRSVKTLARSSVRLDLDILYEDESSTAA